MAYHRYVEGRIGSEIWTRPVDQSSPAQKLTNGRHSHFSSDSRFLVFTRDSGETGQDLWYLELGQEGDPKEFLTTEQNESGPRLSPDSRWIAYTSDDSGQEQICVKKFPSGEGLRQISTMGGASAHWSPDGDELFYLQGQDLMVVGVNGTNSLDPGRPTKLFTENSGFRTHYAVGEGGESFIFTRPAGNDDIPPSIAIVQNWFSEYRDRQ